MNADLKFPKGFLWGTATSAHQVEGNNKNNNWWQWEQQEGRIKEGQSSEIACDHWDRYNEDFDLITKLNNNAYRMSIEWSRIFPKPHITDQEAIEHYHKMLDELHNRNITPFVTLHHFTNPIWWEKEGGLKSQKTNHLNHFKEFIEVLVKEYGDKIHFWNTINEPNIVAMLGYYLGVFPPGEKTIRSAFNAGNTLLLMHAKAYNTIKSNNPSDLVGLVKNMAVVKPLNPKSRMDRLTTRFVDYGYNGATLRSLRTGKSSWSLIRQKKYLKRSFDFIGLNFYNFLLVSRSLKELGITARPETDKELLCEGLDWEPYPEGILINLQRLNREFPGIPIYITENGIGTNNDEWRQRCLIHHLIKMHKAIELGIPVKGYFHWSLLDNFEWAEGYNSKFGLVEVNFLTQERKIKGSGNLYSGIAQRNSISSDLIEKFRSWPISGMK
ncbi:MAG: glycoside hydrolase family 1 protein [Candidatus Thorarchaeota archaeon]